VANSLEAVRHGVTLVQGTANGHRGTLRQRQPDFRHARGGVQTGLALPDGRAIATLLTETSRYIAEVANQVPHDSQPYVGVSAFAHKGGVHVSAMARHDGTYEHIYAGNRRQQAPGVGLRAGGPVEHDS
jgi:2-isopropylmalate synthase